MFIAFKSVMFHKILLQATDSTFEKASEKSIDLDVHELMRDASIGYSLESIKMIEKGLKKINEDILRLVFILLQIDEIKAKVDVLVKRSHVLQVSWRILNHNINSFSAL